MFVKKELYQNHEENAGTPKTNWVSGERSIFFLTFLFRLAKQFLTVRFQAEYVASKFSDSGVS